MKKNIPKIREREKNEKIYSHNSGKGIRGFHSWEWTGTGVPAHPCGVDMLLSLANRIGIVVVVMFRSNFIIFCNFQQYRLRLRPLWKRNRARQRLISTPLTWSISTCCKILKKNIQKIVNHFWHFQLTLPGALPNLVAIDAALLRPRRLWPHASWLPGGWETLYRQLGFWLS